MSFLVLRGLTVHGASAMGCPLLVGYPTLTAMQGFANVVLRNFATTVDLDASDVRLTGLAVVHHTGALRAYGRYGDRLTQKRYAYDAPTKPGRTRHGYYITPPEKPMPEADVTLSLLLRVESDVPLGAVVDRLKRDEMLDIAGTRALGGTLETLHGIMHGTDLRNALRKVPPGWLLLDRSKELLRPDTDPLGVLLEKLFPPSGLPFRRLLPLQAGWRCLTKPMVRETPRGPATHAFAEPLIGMGEFVRASQATEADLAAALWCASIDHQRNIYLLECDHHEEQPHRATRS
jgi:hypothetical protein